MCSPPCVCFLTQTLTTAVLSTFHLLKKKTRWCTHEHSKMPLCTVNELSEEAKSKAGPREANISERHRDALSATSCRALHSSGSRGLNLGACSTLLCKWNLRLSYPSTNDTLNPETLVLWVSEVLWWRLMTSPLQPEPAAVGAVGGGVPSSPPSWEPLYM